MYAAVMADTFKHYWYGAGLKLEQEFLFAENILLRPVQLNSKIHLLEDRAETQRDYGFLCALADTISFELKITADTAKNAAMHAWNYQYILILLSIYKTCPIAWPFQCHSSAISDSNSKITHMLLVGAKSSGSSPEGADLLCFWRSLKRMTPAASIPATSLKPSCSSVNVSILSFHADRILQTA